MPVRIYEIAKNLGIKSKDVLEKAGELGIQNARVASSSLDKITAEFLELEIAKQLKPAEKTPVEAKAPVDSGPVLIVAPEEEPPVGPSKGCCCTPSRPGSAFQVMVRLARRQRQLSCLPSQLQYHSPHRGRDQVW